MTDPTTDDIRGRSAGRQSRWLLLYLMLAILLLPLLAVILNFPQSFIGYSLAAAFVFHVIIRNRPAEWIAAALVGGLFNQAAKLAAPSLHLPANTAVFSLAMLGAGSLMVLGWRLVWTSGQDSSNLRQTYLPAVALLALVLASQLALLNMPMRGLETLDAYLQAFDLSLIWPPVFFLGRAFQRVHYSRYVAQIAYSILPMMVAVVCGGYIRYRNASPWPVLKIMAVAGVLGYAGYLLFPAVGPAYIPEFTFPAVPFTLADVAPWRPHLLLAPASAARNAMPSLHMAWALLIWLNARGLPRVFRTLTFIYVLLTITVILGLGEHYVADLLVAVPFSVLVQALCSGHATSSLARWRAAFGSALLVAAWLLVLRYETAFFFLAPVIPWACAIVSSGMSAILLSPLLKTNAELHRNDSHQLEASLSR
jgi:PAP2 superfamily